MQPGVSPASEVQDDAAIRLARAVAGDGLILSALKEGKVGLSAQMDGFYF